MAAFTPVLYGSKLARKPAAPIALRGVPPGKTAPPPTYSLANLLRDRAGLQSRFDLEQSASDRRPGSISVTQRKLQLLDEQINAAQAPAIRAVAPRPKPVAAVVAPVAAPAPAPVAAVAPVATPGPVETQATSLKLAAEEQARAVEKAKADELARQDAMRRRRGYGVDTFVTGGLRGLPNAYSLAQLLGI